MEINVFMYVCREISVIYFIFKLSITYTVGMHKKEADGISNNLLWFVCDSFVNLEY